MQVESLNTTESPLLLLERANFSTLIVIPGSVDICALARRPEDSSLELVGSFPGYYSTVTPVKAASILQKCPEPSGKGSQPRVKRSEPPANGPQSPVNVSSVGSCERICNRSPWVNLYNSLRLNLYEVRYH